jgi:molybdopterin converting factor small subunit
MHIHLEYVAVLEIDGPVSGSTIELPEGARVADLLDRLHVIKPHQSCLTVSVNLEKARLHRVLKDGDEVFLAIPISGG